MELTGHSNNDVEKSNIAGEWKIGSIITVTRLSSNPKRQFSWSIVEHVNSALPRKVYTETCSDPLVGDSRTSDQIYIDFDWGKRQFEVLSRESQDHHS